MENLKLKKHNLMKEMRMLIKEQDLTQSIEYYKQKLEEADLKLLKHMNS